MNIKKRLTLAHCWTFEHFEAFAGLFCDVKPSDSFYGSAFVNKEGHLLQTALLFPGYSMKLYAVLFGY